MASTQHSWTFQPSVFAIQPPFFEPTLREAVASVTAMPPAKRNHIEACRRPRRNRLVNIRAELLLLAERAGERSIKADLSRLADSLTPRPPSRALQPLSELEVRQLLYIAKSRPEWKSLHALLLFVGCGKMSCAELFTLRRDDVILDRGKPRISVAGSRIVTLSLQLAEAAEALLASSEQWGSCRPEHFVLIRQTSKYGNHPCDPTRPAYIRLFRRQFDDVRSLAGVPCATWRRLEASGRMGVMEC